MAPRGYVNFTSDQSDCSLIMISLFKIARGRWMVPVGMAGRRIYFAYCDEARSGEGLL